MLCACVCVCMLCVCCVCACVRACVCVTNPHLFSISWGPTDDGQTVEAPGSLAQLAFQLGTAEGRSGYGNIYVFASGNGGLSSDNCNYDGYANSIYTVTIGALDEQDRAPYYAERCASLLAVTYSNGNRGGDRNIVTADITRLRGCTDGFSGTSAAAPMAAGVLALALQVRWVVPRLVIMCDV